MQSQITEIIEKIDRQTGLLYQLRQRCEDHFRTGIALNKQEIAGAHHLLESMARDWANGGFTRKSTEVHRKQRSALPKRIKVALWIFVATVIGVIIVAVKDHHSMVIEIASLVIVTAVFLLVNKLLEKDNP